MGRVLAGPFTPPRSIEFFATEGNLRDKLSSSIEVMGWRPQPTKQGLKAQPPTRTERSQVTEIPETDVTLDLSSECG